MEKSLYIFAIFCFGARIPRIDLFSFCYIHTHQDIIFRWPHFSFFFRCLNLPSHKLTLSMIWNVLRGLWRLSCGIIFLHLFCFLYWFILLFLIYIFCILNQEMGFREQPGLTLFKLYLGKNSSFHLELASIVQAKKVTRPISDFLKILDKIELAKCLKTWTQSAIFQKQSEIKKSVPQIFRYHIEVPLEKSSASYLHFCRKNPYLHDFEKIIFFEK